MVGFISLFYYKNCTQQGENPTNKTWVLFGLTKDTRATYHTYRIIRLQVGTYPMNLQHAEDGLLSWRDITGMRNHSRTLLGFLHSSDHVDGVVSPGEGPAL